MRKYIDQEAAQKIVCSTCEVCRNPTLETLMECEICPGFAKIPAEDVQPVVHGRWIDKKKRTYGMQTFCSACGKHSGIGGIESNRHKPFCPNCGARMDLED